MKIIKRSGQEVEFDIEKIVSAVRKANREMDVYLRIDDKQILEIAESVTKQCEALNHSAQVEEVQDMVEDRLMDMKAFALARKYITYRFKRDLVRKVNTTDAQILALIECNSEVAKQENSNKNPTVNSVQRDYMAGEVSKDLTRRVLLPEDIVRAREVVKDVYMDEKIERYIVDIVYATRTPEDYGLGKIAGFISYGASPRASISLAMASKAYAFIKRRGYVIPEDVRAVCYEVLRHRIGLTYEAEAENMTTDQIISEIINAVEVP